ncbi:unnamed protein product [Cylicocyclus nassatus]|uniref:Uncharacterized protein n=1 Tax=Cylicocyclus nassatus TaxID=53992 RepID=A0AA36H7A1_CYLNA|nr:unnamed protein product [Cylicocyclus nassatus]
MRIFRLTVLLLTLLVILSAVDVGECGLFGDILGLIFKPIGEKIKKSRFFKKFKKGFEKLVTFNRPNYLRSIRYGRRPRAIKGE